MNEWMNECLNELIIHLKKLLGSDCLKRSAFLVNTVQKRVTQCRKVKRECKLQRRYPKLKRRLPEANRCISKTAEDRAKPSEDFRRPPEYFRRTPEHFRRAPEYFRRFPKTCDNLLRSPKITGYFFKKLYESRTVQFNSAGDNPEQSFFSKSCFSSVEEDART